MVVTLGWMLVTGLPLPARSPNQITVVPVARPSPAPRVRVWTEEDEPYQRGEGVRVYLSTSEPSHVAVFRVDTDGRLRVLFPLEPWGETFVRDDRTFEVGGARGGRSFVVDDHPGVGYLLAVASPHRFEFADITRGDYWDYRLIDGGRLRGDPYVHLTDVVRRITPGAEYDYEIVPYYVGRRYDYPRFVCYECHAAASYEQWDPYERACSRFRVVVYEGPAHYPYRSGRGRDVVTPGRLAGPRYVFLDADPRRDYVTRVPAAAAAGQRADTGPGRSADDVGGRGAVPAPGRPSLGRRGASLGDVDTPATRPSPEERRRPPAERRRKPGADEVPEGLRPAEGERRLAPEQQRDRPPRSTGEPELRRRRP